MIQDSWVELHTVWVEYSVRAAVRVFGDNVTVNDVTVHQSGACDSDGNELLRSVSYSNLNRGFDSNCAETTSVVNCSSFDDAFSYHNVT